MEAAPETTRCFCVIIQPPGVCSETTPSHLRYTIFTVFSPHNLPQKQTSEMLLTAVGMVTDDGTAPGFTIPLVSVPHSRFSVQRTRSRPASFVPCPPVRKQIRLTSVRRALTCTRRCWGRRDAREGTGRPSADRGCPTGSR